MPREGERSVGGRSDGASAKEPDPPGSYLWRTCLPQPTPQGKSWCDIRDILPMGQSPHLREDADSHKIDCLTQGLEHSPLSVAMSADT